MINQPIPMPDYRQPFVDPKTGLITKPWYDYKRSVDEALRKILGESRPVTAANLPTAGNAGALAFVSDGRKSGETAGNGTGVLAYDDGTAWRATDTSATVAT